VFGERKHREAWTLATPLVGLVCLLECDPPTPINAPPSPNQASSGQTGSASESWLRPVFIDVDIVHIYQVLLLNGLTPHEKSQRWSQFYNQRWVRWTAQLAHIKPDALLLRHMGGTGTYDVLLKTARTPGQAAPRLTQGRFYNYIGRLERYDDGFQTLYLEQGVVMDAGPDGVPGTLATEPEQTRKLPDPPKPRPPTPPQ
jgi:hypothetical protein